MICPKCNGTGKVKFSYTQRYTAWNNCDYEGCVGGIINCCDGIQEQPDRKKCLVRQDQHSGGCIDGCLDRWFARWWSSFGDLHVHPWAAK